MRLSETTLGRQFTIEVRVVSGPDEFPASETVFDTAVFASDSVRLRHAGRDWLTEPLPGPSSTDCEALSRRAFILVWLAAAAQIDDEVRLTLRCHAFDQTVALTDPVEVGVDMRAVKRVSQLSGQRVRSPGLAGQWLAEAVLFPPTAAGPAAVLTGDVEAGKFRLVGPQFAVDVEEDSGRYRVRRIVPRRGNLRQTVPLWLVLSPVCFVDGTEQGRARNSIRAQLEVLAKSGGYLETWAHYQKIEKSRLLGRAAKVKPVAYARSSLLASGVYRFEADGNALRTFANQLEFQGLDRVVASARCSVAAMTMTRGLPPLGEIKEVHVAAGYLDMLPAYEDGDEPPSTGFLLPSLAGDERRLERRAVALDVLQSASAPMPHLPLILETQPFRSIRSTRSVRRVVSPAARAALGAQPTHAQREAIRAALETPDIVLIQGPPGTGKTAVIAAIEARLAEDGSDGDVLAGQTLLTSFQHDAVDNAAARSQVMGIPALRLGGRAGETPGLDLQQNWVGKKLAHMDEVLAVMPDDRPLAQYRFYRDEVAMWATSGEAPDPPRELAQRLREACAHRLSVSSRLALDELLSGVVGGRVQWVAVLNRALRDLRLWADRQPASFADALQEFRDTLDVDPTGVTGLLGEYAAVHAATVQQSAGRSVRASKEVEQGERVQFETVIVDEAARANPLDLLIPLSMAQRRIVLVGDHRQLPHMLDPDVERELKTSVKEEEQRALSESLFEKLFRWLRRYPSSDRKIRVVSLQEQFRMHPVLGNFVSRVFYEPYGEGFSSPRPASDFVHHISGYEKQGRPVCAAWKDIPLERGLEEGRRSKARPVEARWIAREVQRVLREDREVSIGVVAFYRGQVNQILESLGGVGLAERVPDRDSWRLFSDAESGPGRLHVGTVDAFQGKEFDVVFVSVTRCNALRETTEDERRRKWGHLMISNRLCVALSRQKRLLVVVGDRAMYETDAAHEAVPGLHAFLELCGGEDGLVA